MAYAPLYVGEIVLLNADDGSRQIRRHRANGNDAGDRDASAGDRSAVTIILRDGPIEGITPRYKTRTDEQADDDQRTLGLQSRPLRRRCEKRRAAP